MSILTSSSWSASLSSSSLNSISSSFTPFLIQTSSIQPTCAEVNIQPRQLRPITGQIKQKKLPLLKYPAQIQAVAPVMFLNNSIAFLTQFPQPSEVTSVKYSRKVFVGGLPSDIDQDEIALHFSIYGQLTVDWPHKSETKSVIPPKGYVFLIFEKEKSVQDLMNSCQVEKNKYYLTISSQSLKDKQIQIRPWKLIDADYTLSINQPIDSRKTIFVGGVPRPLKSIELALIMERLYGGVCYAGKDTDPELKYPKGAARVTFSNQHSYVAAVNARFVQLQKGDIDKRAEVKPYVLEDQPCDLCSGMKCGGKSAPFFCANVACLQYYCEGCWSSFHAKPGRDFHKPLVKEGADRPRAIPFRWC